MTRIIKDTIHANGIDIGIYTTDFENDTVWLSIDQMSELEKMEKSLFSMGTHMMNLKILL